MQCPKENVFFFLMSSLSEAEAEAGTQTCSLETASTSSRLPQEAKSRTNCLIQKQLHLLHKIAPLPGSTNTSSLRIWVKKVEQAGVTFWFFPSDGWQLREKRFFQKWFFFHHLQSFPTLVPTSGALTRES